MKLLVNLLILYNLFYFVINDKIPIVANVWKFVNATKAAWNSVYYHNASSIDSIVDGCSKCEEEQCDGTVGYGGSPDENGETTLDALIFDGTTFNVGAVGGLRRIKNAIGVARKVLQNTKHSFLVGDLATEFAVSMGFKQESLKTPDSISKHNKWKTNRCQPNFWMNVKPDPLTTCGPYEPITNRKTREACPLVGHDTIGMIVIDRDRNIVAGTSTNGLNHKIPGRVGDSPIPGSGGYADSEVGGAVSTGDGDIILRFVPAYQAVEYLKFGYSPKKAAEKTIQRIIKKFPNVFMGLLVVDKHGNHGAACNGIQDVFHYSVAEPENGFNIYEIKCLSANDKINFEKRHN